MQDVTLTLPMLPDMELTASKTACAMGEHIRMSQDKIDEIQMAVVEAYRYGWDLLDPDDPDDPGWVIPWLTELNASTQTFSQGIHGFTVQVRDDQGRLTRGSFLLDVQDQVSVERIRLGGFKSGFVGR